MAENEPTSGFAGSDSAAISDTELIQQFQESPDSSWRIFVNRYADFIFSVLRNLGFDHDQAMDRFVYICEKLAEDNFRRLRRIKYAGTYGELKPWLRQVINRLVINWAWAEDGRRRLLRPIQHLGELEQKVFELHFWYGLSPTAIDERLRLEHVDSVSLAAVYQALDRIHSVLSEKKIWRLLSNLLRTQRAVALEELYETYPGLEPIDTGLTPEELLAKTEEEAALARALRRLTTQEALVLQLRYDDDASYEEIAAILKLTEVDVRRIEKTAIARLREDVGSN